MEDVPSFSGAAFAALFHEAGGTTGEEGEDQPDTGRLSSEAGEVSEDTGGIGEDGEADEAVLSVGEGSGVFAFVSGVSRPFSSNQLAISDHSFRMVFVLWDGSIELWLYSTRLLCTSLEEKSGNS